jgi:Tol biopolymer transport system component
MPVSGADPVRIPMPSQHMYPLGLSPTQKLISLKDFTYGPQFAPDGRRIRFTVREPNTGVRSLWEVTTEGKRLHLLPGWQHPSSESAGRWTTDGKYFIFEAQGQIWALPDRAGLFGQH